MFVKGNNYQEVLNENCHCLRVLKQMGLLKSM